MRRWVIVAGVACLALLALSMVSFQGHAEEVTTQDSVLFRLLIGGRNLGYLEPCGCAEGMLGGLPRRAAWTARERERVCPTLLLDNGDWTSGVDLLQEYKIRAYARALRQIGPHLVRPGLNDLPLGLPQLARHADESGSQLVAADLIAPELVPFVDLRLAGTPVRVSSLSDPEYDLEIDAILGASGRRLPPDSALAVLSSGCPDSAVVVVLYGAGRRSAESLFVESSVDLVIAGDAAPPSPASRLPGGGIVVSLGDRGQYLLEIAWLGPERGFVQERILPLDGRIPDSPPVRAILEQYLNELRRDRLASRITRKIASGSFVGSQSCRDCHPLESAVFEGSRHSNALSSLIDRRQQENPDCLPCHTVGFGFVSGFVDEKNTSYLGQVGCESCHGVGSDHVADSEARYGQVAPKTCLGCHNPINSPEFDFESYWKKIRHGDGRQ